MKTELILALAGCALCLAVPGCGPNRAEQRLRRFLSVHTETLVPLQKEANLAYWEAAVTGDTAAYGRYAVADMKIRSLYANPFEYKQLTEWKAEGGVRDPRLARQLDVLVNAYLVNQADPDLLKRISGLAAEAEGRFSTFRPRIGGREATANEIDAVLKSSGEAGERRRAWEASKAVGPLVARDVRRLVKLRNQVARNLGFPDFHALSLSASEQDPAEVARIFGELARLTEEPFRAYKSGLDSALARRTRTPVSAVRPWHYHDPFFQEAPQVAAVNFDPFYKSRDVRALAEGFFSGIGLPVGDILARSDLFEKPGKNPHAFCTDIDREGDVRMLCNLRDDERWMGTLLHELGHAVYSANHDPGLPFLLRDAAHAFVTEAVAEYFGDFSQDADWMKAALGLSDADAERVRGASAEIKRAKRLVFARWSLVMFDFERALYADPERDLDALWWDLVEKYQGVRRPEGRKAPDWAAKIHFVMAPCYYHNYLLGELLASQIRRTVRDSVLKTTDNPAGVREAGKFLREEIFRPGRLHPWNVLVEKATGEPLNPEYFVREFGS
jgi:peptidyl-dipeptidase A